MSWMERAACASGHDPDMWFDPSRREQARRVCDTCPVRLECLQEGLGNRRNEGVWGGVELLRGRVLTPAPVPPTTPSPLAATRSRRRRLREQAA